MPWRLTNMGYHLLSSIHFLVLAAGMDYTPLSMDLTFNTAVTSQTVAVTIMDDLVVERSEIINLTLTSTDPAVILNPSTSTITIEDVDSKLLDVGYYTLASMSVTYSPSHFSGHDWIQQNSLFRERRRRQHHCCAVCANWNSGPRCHSYSVNHKWHCCV